MHEGLFSLSGEIAVVIGGTGELGGAIAEALAGAGASVAVVGRNAERGARRVATITERDGVAEFFSADAGSREALRALRAAVEAKWGPAGVLVNASGGNDPRATVTPDNPFEAIAAEEWSACIESNLYGGLLFPCQEFGPAMCTAGRGSIINIASVSAHIPLSRVSAYSAAKAAVLSLSQFLAREWAPHGVRVNTITPGFFPADQNRRLLMNPDGTPTERAAAILGHTPMKRFGQASELGGAAVFLASEKASSFVTGADLRVDGGFLSQTI